MGNSKNKPANWHSRRHQTSEAQDAAREAYRTRAEGRPRQVWVDTAQKDDGSGYGKWVREDDKGRFE